MKNVLKEILSTSVYLLIVLLAAYFIITYVGQRTQVSGSSMETTLSDGDNLIVDKISYRFHEPERFDIIVFPFQYAKNTFYIKRIIGLPGERVRIDEEGNIYINDELLEESYGREVIAYAGRAAEEIQLADDEYFVLGDNRNNSSDSRDPSVGNIKREKIIGRAWVRIWPFSKFGVLKHQ
ncbi:MAG: signal peptidase I [Eubacterium sp.]|nr:signal peptidase I [Eubacterium sp.]